MLQKISMKRDRKNFGWNLVCGIIVCLLTMLACIAAYAALIRSETITEGACGYYVVSIHLMSIMMGGSIALKGEKGNTLCISLLLGLIYGATLLAMTTVIFGGQYQGVLATAGVIITGCMIPVITGKCRINVGKTRRSRKRRC